MTISMQVAREHHAEGERVLAIVQEAVDTKPEEVTWEEAAVHITAMAGLAAAHFAASMSATGILLADPTEMPEPVER